MFSHARAAWQYRNFILASIKSELKGRFASSRLGALWHILHPLAMALIYSLVLAQVLGARLPGVEGTSAYAVYLVAGIASWGLFTEIVNRCLGVFIHSSETLKKISFPRIALPLIVFGNALVNHLLLLVSASFIFLILGFPPTIYWLALPVGLLLAAILGFGLGIFLGVLNVFIRDVGQFISIALQLWFWLTPIVYPINILGEQMQRLVQFNPMTPVVMVYQNALIFQKWPDFSLLVAPGLLAVCFVAVSLVVFQRASAEIVDAL